MSDTTLTHTTLTDRPDAATGGTARRDGARRRLTVAIRLNAAFCAACGVVATAAAGPLADWMDIPTWLVAGSGVALVAYAAMLWLLTRRPLGVAEGLVPTIGDVAWVIVIGLVAATGVGGVSDGGRWLLAASCVPVADFALAQWLQIRRLR